MQSSQWSICAHLHAVAATAGPTMCHGVRDTGQRCIVRDMMHEVRAKPPEHTIRSAGWVCHQMQPPKLRAGAKRSNLLQTGG